MATHPPVWGCETEPEDKETAEAATVVTQAEDSGGGPPCVPTATLLLVWDCETELEETAEAATVVTQCEGGGPAFPPVGL